MFWRLEYSPDASSYALDSLPYNEAVLLAIQDLAFMPSPYPSGITEILPGVLGWEVADHMVYYQVFEENLTIRVIAIKPLI
jgi:hypothetical protein